jgi:serine phosphatase RsbU (regulator of sigma subunit)
LVKEVPAGTQSLQSQPAQVAVDPSRLSSNAVLHGSTIVVVIIGLLITGVATWVAWTLNARTESRLLHLQTSQAAEVLLAAVPDTTTPLITAAEIAGASNGSPAAFEQYMGSSISGGPFVSASLWEQTTVGVQLLASIGGSAGMPTDLAAARSTAERALMAKSFVVTGILGNTKPSVGYAFALPGAGTRYVVYAEHAIPADRKSTVATNAAFSELHYAIYLGTPTNSHLLTSDFPDLTVTGSTDTVTVPFGNTVLTFVAGPVGQLGGTLSSRLPWILALVGILLTVGAAWTTERLVRRRLRAEDDSVQIEHLYTEQQTIAATLQRALLPKVSPGVPGLDVAVHYKPGAKGVEIGGDWYSIVVIDENHVGFVVGDVSGRGIGAAAIMADLRFTIRTLLLEGNSPTSVLDKCSSQMDVGTDGHFATVLVGVADIDAGVAALASAGHLPPLLQSSGQAWYVEVPIGAPLGVVSRGYQSATVPTPPGSLLIGFTDGLVERRGEDLDVGLGRLQTAVQAAHGSLDELVTKLIDDLAQDTNEDDIALLAMRWVDDQSPEGR